MYVCTHGYDCLEQKDTKHTGKRKRYKKRSPGEIRHRCAEVLFQRGCTQHTSQQWVLTVDVKCCQPGKLIRDFVPRAFTWEPAWPKCNLQTPRRKAGVQQKPYYLHNEFRHSDWHYLGWWDPSTSKLPDASQGPTLQSILLPTDQQIL